MAVRPAALKNNEDTEKMPKNEINIYTLICRVL